MKKITSIVTSVALLALLRAEPAKAVDMYLFNAATANGPSNPAIQQVGGDQICELKIDSASTSEVIVTIYSAAEASNGALVNPAIWFQVTNPTNGDPNNHLVGTCPNFVGGVMSSYLSGSITVRLRSKK